VILNIRDSKLYISFSIGSESSALLRHYVLSLRRRFCNVRGALGRVGRLVVNHVIILLYLNNTTRYYVSIKEDLSLLLKLSKPINSKANRLLRALLILNTRTSLIVLEEYYLFLKDN
jgi:hypothetical protein